MFLNCVSQIQSKKTDMQNVAGCWVFIDLQHVPDFHL